MGKDWVEHWLDPDDDLKEVEVDPDVFYDYFLSIPTVKCQRHFKEYKTQFLAKIKDGSPEEFAKDVGQPNDENLKVYFSELQQGYKVWQQHNWDLKEAVSNENVADVEKLSMKKRKAEEGLTLLIKEHFDKVKKHVCLFFYYYMQR